MMFKKSIKIGKDTFVIKNGYMYKNPKFDEDRNIRTYADIIPVGIKAILQCLKRVLQ